MKVRYWVSLRVWSDLYDLYFSSLYKDCINRLDFSILGGAYTILCWIGIMPTEIINTIIQLCKLFQFLCQELHHIFHQIVFTRVTYEILSQQYFFNCFSPSHVCTMNWPWLFIYDTDIQPRVHPHVLILYKATPANPLKSSLRLWIVIGG